jgi:hypothetical protein
LKRELSKYEVGSSTKKKIRVGIQWHGPSSELRTKDKVTPHLFKQPTPNASGATVAVLGVKNPLLI